MTVADTSRKAGPFDGNGVTTSFPFDFKVFAKTDLAVVRTNDIGIETDLVLDSDYTVVLNADQDAAPGGTVTYEGPPVLPTGWKLTVVGATPYDQTTDITNVGRFNPNVIEQTLDRTVIQVQQLVEQSLRTVKVPVSSNTDPRDLLQQFLQAAFDVMVARDLVVEISIHFSDEANARLDVIQAEGEAILDAFSADGQALLTAVKIDADSVLAALGYLVPVPYGPGLDMTSARQTVSFGGNTYAPIQSALPFTTSGTFEAAKFRLIQGVSGADLSGINGGNMVGIGTGLTALDALLFARRVLLKQHPLISDTVEFQKLVAGATKVHIEPNGRSNTGTQGKLDVMFDDLALVASTFGEGASVASYNLFNVYTDRDYTYNTNGIVALNVKGRGNQFGVWPMLAIGFQDVAANAVPMKVMFFDSQDGLPTNFKGMWWPNEAVALNETRVFSNRIYRAAAPGVTGFPGPSHAVVGDVAADGGGVPWQLVSDPSAHSGAVIPTVVFGNLADMPKKGYPTARAQFAKQALFHNGVRLSFMKPDDSLSAEIYARSSDGKFYPFISPDGTHYALFDPATGDINLAGARFVPRVRSLTGAETAVDVTDYEVLRLAQPGATTITSITGKPYQQIQVFAANSNTTLQHGAAINLKGGANYNLTTGRCVPLILNGAGTTASEIGT